MKKLIEKCPFLILLVSTGILFTLLGLVGRSGIYREQEYDLVRKPALAAVFTAWKDGIYPWQILDGETAPAMAEGEQGSRPGAGSAGGDALDGREEDSQSPAVTSDDAEKEDGGFPVSGAGRKGMELFVSGNMLGKSEDAQAGTEADVKPSSEADEGTAGEDGNSADPEMDNDNSGEIPEGRPEPLRESTREEYLNHISADIYGDAGVRRAAEYSFVTVDESYFDDALFIGDSRTVGLRDYTDLSDHADFCCETSLTIQKALKENYPGMGTVEEILARRDYGKIYIMVGINELGVGTTEDFMRDYTAVVDTLRQKEPQARIFIQGIMRVTDKKNSTDAIFNNSNINARNNAIATLADNEHIFYIDVNEVVCDEEGNLNTEYTFDQLHLLGKYNDLWKQFLLAHGVEEKAEQ